MGFRAFGCIMSGALFSLSTQFTFEQGVGKRSFAEVATIRQRLFIWLLGPDCGSFSLRRPLPRLSERRHKLGDAQHTPKALRRFVIDHLERIDFRRVDKFELVRVPHQGVDVVPRRLVVSK